MSFHALDPVWPYILQYLTTPLPAPLSGFTKAEAILEPGGLMDSLPDFGAPGTVSRKEIGARSRSLAVLMRTSVAFNQYTAPLLYRQIITSDIGRLSAGLAEPPANPHIDSKAALFHHTRHISLEYRAKGVSLSYADLMYDSRYWRLIDMPLSKEGMALQSAVIEIDHIRSGLANLATHTSFPKLHTISLGTIFGGQRGIWEETAPLYGSDGRVADKIADCTRLLQLAFQSSPIALISQHGAHGPLSLAHLAVEGGLAPLSWGAAPLRPLHLDALSNLASPRGYWELELHHPEPLFPVGQGKLRMGERSALAVYPRWGAEQGLDRIGGMSGGELSRKGMKAAGVACRAGGLHRKNSWFGPAISEWCPSIQSASCKAYGWIQEEDEGDR